MKEIAMPRPPRRSLPLQPDLFERSPPPPGTPAWTTLPDRTRHALTELVTRMLIAHVGAGVTLPGDADDDL